MTYNLVLTEEAEDDFADILMYTQETWSSEQRRRYATQIDNALAMLENNPKLGTKTGNCHISTVCTTWDDTTSYTAWKIPMSSSCAFFTTRWI